MSDRGNINSIWIECLTCKHRDFRSIILGTNEEITKKINQMKYVHNLHKSCKNENIIIWEGEQE